MIIRLGFLSLLLAITSCGIDPVAGLFEQVNEVSNYGSDDTEQNNQHGSETVRRRGTVIGNGDQVQDQNDPEIEAQSNSTNSAKDATNSPEMQNYAANNDVDHLIKRFSIGGINGATEDTIKVLWEAVPGIGCKLIKKTGFLLKTETVIASNSTDDPNGEFSGVIDLRVFGLRLVCGPENQPVYDKTIYRKDSNP